MEYFGSLHYTNVILGRLNIPRDGLQESFLEDIDSLLNTGEVPNLFATDEKADLMEMVRPAMVAAASDKNADFTPLALFSFFINKCKENLHIVMAFSPIGDAFRNR